MRGAAVGQAEAGSGLKQRVGLCGEGVEAAAEGAVGCEDGGSEIVGVESSDGAVVAAAAGGGAVRGGACEMGWISRCQAQRGRSGVRRLSVAVSDGFAAADGEMGAAFVAAPAVYDVQCCLRFSPHYLPQHVCLLQQLRLRWTSEKGSAPACLRKRPLSFV